MLTAAGRPAPAEAQVTLRDQMFNLFEQNILLSRTPAGVGIVAHTPVFREDAVVRETADLINQVSSQIGLQLSSYPLGSSAGGFTYGFDPELGTFSRTTETFGPAFAERAATAGRGRFSVGMNYLHASYSTLDGQALEDGDIKFNLFHQRLTPASYVEGDVIQAALRMRLTSDTTSFLFNYGLTNRLDIGLAVPLVRVRMDLSYQATILDFATATVSPTTHLFANGTKTQTFESQGEASGVGDVVVRTRYNFARSGITGVALGLDVRVPSGDEANMLGTGATQTRIFLIASGGGRVSPHVNVGYTASSGSTNVPDVVNYTGGVEYGVNRRITVNADLLGRSSRNALRLRTAVLPHQYQQGPSAAIQRTTLEAIAVTPGSVNTAIGAIGTKINLWQNLLLSGHVLVPLNDAGLRSRTSGVIGFDYTF
ncbi:MAG: hypothetical protein AB7O32_11085 [Vicinamibacterales bacterium]